MVMIEAANDRGEVIASCSLVPLEGSFPEDSDLEGTILIEGWFLHGTEDATPQRRYPGY